MYAKILGLLAGALVLGVSLGGCEQPPITCRVAGGPFAMKYTLKSGTGACAEMKGETVGLAGYNGLGAVSEGGPDLSIKRVAIQAASTVDLLHAIQDFEDCPGGDFVGDAADKSVYAIGNFADTLPAEDNSCIAPAPEPARLTTTEVPEHPDCGFEEDPDAPSPVTCFDGMLNADETGVDCGGVGCAGCVSEPAHDITYKWTNVNVHVTGDTPGTVMTADLEFSDVGCSATYTAVGLFPSVDCSKLDAEGNPTTEPDRSICIAEANVELGVAVGSGINPALFDFVACDPETLLCVLNTTDLTALP